MTTSWFAPWSSSPWRLLDPISRESDWPFGLVARPTRRLLGTPFPAVNVYESTDGFVLMAELPGIAPEDIELATEGRHLTLKGERRIDYADDVSIHRRERRKGHFRRSFELPEEADLSKAEAAFRNGILMLRIPKAEAHQKRTISVQRA